MCTRQKSPAPRGEQCHSKGESRPGSIAPKWKSSERCAATELFQVFAARQCSRVSKKLLKSAAGPFPIACPRRCSRGSQCAHQASESALSNVRLSISNVVARRWPDSSRPVPDPQSFHRGQRSSLHQRYWHQWRNRHLADPCLKKLY